MSGTREQIMDALLAILQARLGAAGSNVIKSFARRFIMYEDFKNMMANGTSPALPALYLFDGTAFGGGVDAWEQRNPGTPDKRTMDRSIVIYATIPGAGSPSGPDGTTSGGHVLQPLIEAVEAGMAPDNMVLNLLTLGGLCRHAWIEGQGFLVSGDVDPSGLCMQTIPVRILIP